MRCSQLSIIPVNIFQDLTLNKLNAWREAKDFAVLIYQTILPKLPQDEKWGIGMQLRRASQSISTNIAEGFGRYYYQDMVRFSYIARGSLEETISLIALCYDLGFIDMDDKQSVSIKSNQLLQIINGYIAYLKKVNRETKKFRKSEKTQPYMEIPCSLQRTILHSLFSILNQVLRKINNYGA